MNRTVLSCVLLYNIIRNQTTCVTNRKRCKRSRPYWDTIPAFSSRDWEKSQNQVKIASVQAEVQAKHLWIQVYQFQLLWILQHFFYGARLPTLHTLCIVHGIQELSYYYFQLRTDLADNVTHILCVFSVNVHLTKTKVWEHEHSRCKLCGLVVVLECLVIITLQPAAQTHETVSNYNMFKLNSHMSSSQTIREIQLSCWINSALCHEDTGQSGGIATSFLNLALDVGEYRASHPNRFTGMEKALSTQWMTASRV
jgi:hypothetical protein